MQRLRQFIRNWLGFSQTETNGFLILLPLITVLVVSGPLYKLYRFHQPVDFSSEYAMLDNVVARWNEASLSLNDSSKTAHPPPRLTKFNPNTATLAELKSLGMSEHLSRRIVSYRQKGGVFRIKQDLLKMYGVDSTYYNQLLAYIDLPAERPFKQTYVREPKRYEIVKKEITSKYNLNDADTLQLKEVKGIGKVLAARIIKFRNALGGFTSLDQLKEIYGLDSAVTLEIKNRFYVEENFDPARISINSADQTTLERHPYISKGLARSIVSYRYQHGSFKNVDEVRNLLAITPQQAEKLLPYLTVND
jgi:competence protein ComEA